ncbi:hypothetical protein ACJQWK_10653 [Exserohilum turcicum]
MIRARRVQRPYQSKAEGVHPTLGCDKVTIFLNLLSVISYSSNNAIWQTYNGATRALSISPAYLARPRGYCQNKPSYHSTVMASMQTAPVALPRVAITYCTQCRWMLRAAYFGQELLSTFGTQIGEIALIPATGGLFTVELTYLPPVEQGQTAEAMKVLLWDRKTEGGFPETKVLKQKVRDCIDPSRDLGHSDKHGKKKETKTEEEGKEDQRVADNGVEVKRNPDGTICEDCR